MASPINDEMLRAARGAPHYNAIIFYIEEIQACVKSKYVSPVCAAYSAGLKA